jgi:hypothetical protein
MTALDLTVVEMRSRPRLRTKSAFSPVVWVVCLSFIFLSGQLLLSGMCEGYCIVWPGIGTRFTRDFSHWGFARIKPGMTGEQVKALIGEPMGVGYGCAPSGWPLRKPLDITWGYSSDSSARGGDWAWLSREVVFRDGRVVQTVKWTYYD